MRVAVIIPCYNEEQTVGETIRSFHLHLPTADIWVCDNKSTDRTSEIAQNAGAKVLYEPIAGKGNAVRRLFADVDADVYVMSDGDTTYDAGAASHMIDELVSHHYDMVIGRRVSVTETAYRPGHVLGNRLFSTFARLIFGIQIADIFSGYRVFSRRFVKTFPAVSEKFEIETELNVHAIDQRLPMIEIDTRYFARPPGSNSKLSTYSDGFRILIALLHLLRDARPFQFFGVLACVLFLVSVILAIPLFYSYLREGVIPRIPTAILVTGIAVVAFVVFTAGVILDALRVARHNQFRVAYLAQDTSYYRDGGGRPVQNSLISEVSLMEN